MGFFTTFMKSSSLNEEALNELQINGETIEDEDGYSVEDDVDDAEVGAATPEDAADNAADDFAGDEEDDFTLDDEDESTAGTETETTDPAPEENQEAPADEGEAEDDFTMDDTNAGDEGGAEGEAPTEGDTATGENPDAGNGQEKATPADPTDGLSDDEAKAAEEQIYDSLTDDQKRIRVLQLKVDFKNLYDTLTNTVEGINGIPKTTENINTISKLVTFVLKAKEILIDYISNNFDKTPYLENYTKYIKYMAVLRTITTIIDEMNAEKK